MSELLLASTEGEDVSTDSAEEVTPIDPVVSSIHMRGVVYPVYCDRNGRFHTEIEGHYLHGPLLGDLVVQAQNVPRRRVSVEIFRVTPGHGKGRTFGPQPGAVTHGYATGFHVKDTNAVLVDWDGQRKGAQHGFRIEGAVRTDTAGLAEIERLLAAQDAAAKAVEDWIEAHEFDVHEAVREALTGEGGDD